MTDQTPVTGYTEAGADAEFINVDENHDVPAGGTTGQILAKSSGTDYAIGWVDAPTGGGSDNVLLIDTVDALPAGTPAGTIVVVKS